MVRRAVIVTTVLLAACAGGVRGPSDTQQVRFSPDLGIDLASMRKTDRGVYYVDTRPGEGEQAGNGSTVRVLYNGWLPDGTLFDATRDASEAVQFRIGAGTVIPGWEEGLIGMRPGGVRRIVVPPSLGYGRRGVESIPPNATLVFEILLIDVR